MKSEMKTLSRIYAANGSFLTSSPEGEDLPVTDRFAFESTPIPEPDAGQVVVKVMTAGLNPVDWKTAVNGVDGAGYVHAVGQGVHRWILGQKVMFHTDLSVAGSFAEYVSVPAAALIEIPSGMGFEIAAALPCPAGTAFQAYQSLIPLLLVPNQSRNTPCILIRGASGAVGSWIVHLLKQHECRVIGIGSHSRFVEMSNNGVDYLIDYKDGVTLEKHNLTNYLFQVGRIADPNEIVLDGVVNLLGPTAFALDVSYLGHRGIYVSIQGRPDVVSNDERLVEPSDTVVVPRFNRAITFAEIALGAAHKFTDCDLERMAMGYKDVAKKVAAGLMPEPEISIIGFDDIPAYLELMRKRQLATKVVANIGLQ